MPASTPPRGTGPFYPLLLDVVAEAGGPPEEDEEPAAPVGPHPVPPPIPPPPPPPLPPMPPINEGEEDEDEEDEEDEEEDSETEDESQEGRHPDSLLASLMQTWGDDLDRLQDKINGELDKLRRTVGLPPRSPPS
ncbi:E4 protein [Mustela putorius papillomavirus 1]|uniref:E4 protein n=1 Tax=Mustela putorius papillomavirus 1 TaxID=2259540 RepID=T1YDH2_9PAPI|nr:E4 protein [Mustela putorius papillomavirus 1]AGU62955.1 E4 protein [Mustela putorius papillomavirus 1]